MSDAGRMPRRLASSYREDGLRGAADRRRQQATTGAGSKPAAVRAPHARPTMRALLSAIGRRHPRVA